MKLRTTAVSIALALSALGMQSALAVTLDLTGLGFVTYGDGESYSLPIANYQYGYNTNNGPYAIPSSPGQIQDLIVLATGASGTNLNTNPTGMDNPYVTPSGTGAPSYFLTDPSTYQSTNGSVTTLLNNAWDASLSALNTFLGGNEMVFFFNNNQEKSSGTANESLAVWARLWLTDGSGNPFGSAYEFTNNDSPYNIVTGGGGGVFMGPTSYNAGSGAGNPTSGPTAGNTDFVLSGGAICVAAGPSLSVPAPVPCGDTPAQAASYLGLPAGSVTTVSNTIDHNLGADHAAYAVVFPELNTAMASLFSTQPNNLNDYTLHVDVRMGCMNPVNALWMSCDIANGYGTGLNNGYEQIFIGTTKTGICPPTDPQCNPTVPEPGTNFLLGLGLAILSYFQMRRPGYSAV